MSISTASAQVATLSRYRYVAAGGETSLTGIDANGNILAYTVGMEQVYLNGTMLVRGQDYTASSGSSITALVALVASDVVEVLTFSPFTVTNAVDQTLIDAKGDILVGTADNVITRVAVGSDGQTLVANSSQTTGLAYTNNFAAGKNKIINGDFGVWQRGTSFTPSGAGIVYNADRWATSKDGTGGTVTVSQQTFTPGTAPVAGYEGTYFARFAQSVVGTSVTYNGFQQNIEDVRQLAGQTVTLSFWAKADATRLVTPYLIQNFGTGGTASTVTTTGSAVSLTTSWVRYTQSLAIPSIAGKTIGTSSYLQLYLGLPTNTVQTIDFWGVQVEAGSVATAFQTATGTLQGELAACQRYYFRANWQALTSYANFGTGAGFSTTQVRLDTNFPVPLRIAPTAIDYPTVATYFTILKYDDVTAPVSAVALDTSLSSVNVGRTNWTVTSGVANTPFYCRGNASTAAYLGWSAEL